MPANWPMIILPYFSVGLSSWEPSISWARALGPTIDSAHAISGTSHIVPRRFDEKMVAFIIRSLSIQRPNSQAAGPLHEPACDVGVPFRRTAAIAVNYGLEAE